MGLVTFALAISVIAVLLFQFPDVYQMVSQGFGP
jgi:hypothetical protein